MRDGRDFTSTVRRGRKAAQPLLVMHLVTETDGDTSVGFVVSKAVGSAVERNRVKRRLRHQMMDRLSAVPSGSRIVIRALPASVRASSDELSAQLDTAIERLVPR